MRLGVILFFILSFLVSGHPCWSTEAQWLVNSAGEGQAPPVNRIRLVTGQTETHTNRTFIWWTLTIKRSNGAVLGIKALSERAPMTTSDGIGEVRRYIFKASEGSAIEYIDQQTNKALLPDLDVFRTHFLPRPAAVSRYTAGFANYGTFLGHSLVRETNQPVFPELEYEPALKLVLRSDLLIGAQADVRDDFDKGVPLKDRQNRPLTLDEYQQMIDAGANYFGPPAELKYWFETKPVFYRGMEYFPDDLYRSNFISGRMFIDEPGIRFGWDAGVSGNLVTPEGFYNALKVRVEEAERPSQRKMSNVSGDAAGAVDFLYNPYWSWETYLWTASAQLDGGARGLVYEGRYVKRGYGWSPELLLGNGLEKLNEKQQFDFFHSYLRGAARQFGRDWGTSIYPEGDHALMLPALVHAYENGAKMLWAWVGPEISFEFRIDLYRKLTDYIAENPRKSITSARDKASTAIVLPAGYIPKEDGIFGVNANGLSQGGGLYGEIAAAALFEGILLSRAGIEYDTISDYPRLQQAGYKNFIFIGENGKVHRTELKKQQPPAKLAITVADKKGNTLPASAITLEQARPGLAPLSDTEHSAAPETTSESRVLPFNNKIKIDGSLEDWSEIVFTTLDRDPYLFGDNWKEEVIIKIPDDASPKSPIDFLGFKWKSITPELRRQFRLEGYSPDEVMAIDVVPGSPADNAGLRSGDRIIYINEKLIRWEFEVWGKMEEARKSPGLSLKIRIQRGGTDKHGGASDLSARVAYAADDDYLYVAADVQDDTHYQVQRPVEMWQNDSLQIGFDPTFARTHGYGEYGHEIGLCLRDGKPVNYRWQGRRGQIVGEVPEVQTSIVRKDGRTIYESAIPIEELSPLSHHLWSQFGMSLTINDSDGSGRKQRLETSPLAMTSGKRLYDYPAFVLPETRRPFLNAAILWNERSFVTGSGPAITIGLQSEAFDKAKIVATLQTIDQETKPASATIVLPVSKSATWQEIRFNNSSQPGRYRLTVKVFRPDGGLATSESDIVYCYR